METKTGGKLLIGGERGIRPLQERQPLFWFGGVPGQPLPSMDRYPNPLRATRNKTGERPVRLRHRLVPGSAFRPLATIDEVLAALFGELHR
jgi:hypothetical protein